MDTPQDDPSPEETPRPESTPANEGEAAGQTGPRADAEIEGELPEWEPLTPELVEDEAIRGDFVLRWTVVLLAFLLGCTQISETETLVHVKTGEHLASHGWWPPARDVFSYTAADRPWINLSWLFDLAAAGSFALGGATGLSLLKAFTAATAFAFLVHTGRTGVPTWWGSVCVGLTLLACYPLFTARPEVVTLLGLAVVLWLLNQAKETGSSGPLWWLLPLFVLWSNLDPRAFLGVMLIALYGLGELAARRARGEAGGEEPSVSRICQVALAGAVALVVNPFTWRALAAPWRLYAIQYPALRAAYPRPISDELAYYSLASGVYWDAPTLPAIAGLVLLATTVVTLILNRRQLKLSHVLVFVGFNALAILTSHELGAASLVNCALATLNAQSWYRATFRQSYSVDAGGLLFSRGGRAVTVLAFFLLAFVTISGRLEGPNGHRTGLGFDFNLRAYLDSLETELADSYDRRPFNFVPRQGDVLIWAGQSVFIDSRLGLYAGSGESDLLALHDRVRRALRASREESDGGGRPDVWKEAFNRYSVTHVLPRLNGARRFPDYITFFDLLSSLDWQLTRLGAVTASFYRTDLDDSELQDYLVARRVTFLDDAFRTAGELTDPEHDWPRPPSAYQRYFSLPRIKLPNAIQLARHELQLARSMPTSPEIQAACAYLVVRNVNRTLGEFPDSAEAYRVLGDAYVEMGRLESQIAAEAGLSFSNTLRYYQAVQAFQNALIIDPSDQDTYWRLAEQYLSTGPQGLGTQRLDLALEALQNYGRLSEQRDDLGPVELERERQRVDLEIQLSQQVQQIRDEVRQQLETDTDRHSVALFAFQSGCVQEALRVLEEAPTELLNNPSATQLRATALIESGRGQQAVEILERLEMADLPSSVLRWRSTAALAHLSNANYTRASQLWKDEIRELDRSRLQSVLMTLPMVHAPLLMTSQDLWPVPHFLAARACVQNHGYESANLLFNTAICAIEAGDNKQGQRDLEELLERAPDAPLRPVVRFYIYLLTDQVIDLEPPSDWIPISPEMFAAPSDDE